MKAPVLSKMLQSIELPYPSTVYEVMEKLKYAYGHSLSSLSYSFKYLDKYEKIRLIKATHCTIDQFNIISRGYETIQK